MCFANCLPNKIRRYLPKLTNNTTLYFSTGRVQHSRFLHAKYVPHSFGRHAHEEFAIGVIYAGAQAVTYRRSEKLLMPTGSIAAINPAEIHTGYAANIEDGWTYRMLYPTFRRLTVNSKGAVA